MLSNRLYSSIYTISLAFSAFPYWWKISVICTENWIRVDSFHEVRWYTLDGIQYIQTAWIFKNSELKARVIPIFLEWNNKGHKTNKHIQTHTHTHTHTHTDVHTQTPLFNIKQSELWKTSTMFQWKVMISILTITTLSICVFVLHLLLFPSRGVRTHKLTKLNGCFRSKTKNHNMRVRLGSSPCHRILRWLFKRFFSKEVKKATSNIRNSAKDKITFLHPICDM